jgi:uncharacterized protein YndB with AHSA1/START domain
MKWLLILALMIAVPILLIVIIGALLPKEHVAVRTVSVRQSPEAVWNQITAPPTWRPDIHSYEELPGRDGHRMWRETDRHGQAITYEAVDAAPPRRLVVRIADAKLPFGGTWTYVIAPQPSGSTLTITENGEVYNPVFRFVSRFVIGHTATIDSYIEALQKKLG